MNKMRRLLALMLCMLLAVSPVGEVLAEGDFFDDEIVIAETPVPEFTSEPTEVPPEAPTEEPAETLEPVVVTEVPTQEPTVVPTASPAPEATDVPVSAEPTVEVTEAPTEEPTMEPTVEPTAEVSEEPSAEPTVEPSVEPTAEVSIEPTVEPSVEPSAEPTIEASVEPSKPTVEPTIEPEQEMLIDYTRSALASPDFVQGYAVLLESAVGYASGYAEAELLYNLEGGVYYVMNRVVADDCDRLEACFSCEGEELTAWIDAACLRPMAEEEILAFISDRIASGDTCYHNGDMNLPLDAPAVSLAVTFSLFSREVEVPVLSVEPGSLILGVSETRDLQVSHSDGQTYALSFVSDNPEIASVSENGTVTGKKRGSTKLHISDEFENTVTLDVAVEKAPTLVKIALDRKTLGV